MLKHKEAIEELASNPEYFHINGKHEGQPNMVKIAKELGLYPDTVSNYLYPEHRERVRKASNAYHQRKREISKTVSPENVMSCIGKYSRNGDSILNMKSLERIEQMVKESESS